MKTKHFTAIAATLREQRPQDDASKQAQWNADVKAMIRVCKFFNVNFDGQRFIDLCGGLFV